MAPKTPPTTIALAADPDDAAPAGPPAGLANLGNTCYLNATLQCLAHVPAFLDWVLQADAKATAAAVVAPSPTPNGLVHELADLYRALCLPPRTAMMPKRFVAHLQRVLGDLLRVRQQNDLSELLLLLLDKLGEDVGRPLPPLPLPDAAPAAAARRGRSRSAAPDDDADDPPLARLARAMRANWHAAHARDHSALKDLAYGQQVVQTSCNACGHRGHSYEVFQTLALEIPDVRAPAVALPALLARHMACELDVGDGVWTCDACKAKQADCTKTHKFWRLPPLLVLTLKRFAHVGGGRFQKVRTPVDLRGADALDLTPYSIWDPHGVYRLCAVACHAGSLQGGHYYAVCRDSGKSNAVCRDSGSASSNASWYALDDLTVAPHPDPTVAPPADVTTTELAHDAYVLFFEKTSSTVKTNARTQ
jgi:ubiquitin carboxyl-terminal hydrolase 8